MQNVSIVPEELSAVVKLNQAHQLQLQLTNQTDGFVAFKVQLTNVKRYRTAPTSGVLSPRDEKTIVIEFKLSAYPSPDEKKDRFKIVTVPIPETRVNDQTIWEDQQLRSQYERKTVSCILSPEPESKSDTEHPAESDADTKAEQAMTQTNETPHKSFEGKLEEKDEKYTEWLVKLTLENQQLKNQLAFKSKNLKEALEARSRADNEVLKYQEEAGSGLRSRAGKSSGKAERRLEDSVVESDSAGVTLLWWQLAVLAVVCFLLGRLLNI
jgi:hypothetical protein